MRKFAAVVLLTLAVVSGAFAGYWNGAGWYIIWDDDYDGGIVERNGGPYYSKESCDANKPPDDDVYIYYCEYHETRPSWDW